MVTFYSNLVNICHHIIPFINSLLLPHLRPSPSSAYTEATMLFSRQSTLDDLDDVPQHVPKTSERARPKLRKMHSMDMSNSSADSGSSNISRSLRLLRILTLSSSPLLMPILRSLFDCIHWLVRKFGHL